MPKKVSSIMQTPQAAQTLSRGKVGYIIVLISSAVVAFSFLVLPALTVDIPYNPYGANAYQGLNSATFLQLAQAFGGNGTLFGMPINATSSTVSLYSNASMILWLLFIFAIVSGVVSFVFLARPVSRVLAPGISFIIMGTMAATVLGQMILMVGAISGSGVPISMGIGGWLCFLGMLATVVGGVVVLVTRPEVVTSGFGNVPPFAPQPSFSNYTQYPPQSSSPGYPPYSPPPSPPGYPPQY